MIHPLLAASLSFVLGAGAAWADIPPPRLERPRPRLDNEKIDGLPPGLLRPVSVEAPLGRVIGVLLEEGHRVCRAGGRVDWLGRYHVLGFTPLEVPGRLGPRRYVGQVVVAEGALAGPAPGRPAGLPEDEAECPQMQMRSDWVESLNGFRVLRDGMGGRGLFRVARLRPWDGLAVRRDGDNLVVEVKNTFRGEVLQDVALVVHYEGCHRKPGTTRRGAPMQTLAFGESFEARFPGIVTEPRGDGEATFAAYSVQVRSRASATAFDLDLALSRANGAVSCPGE